MEKVLREVKRPPNFGLDYYGVIDQFLSHHIRARIKSGHCSVEVVEMLSKLELELIKLMEGRDRGLR